MSRNYERDERERRRRQQQIRQGQNRWSEGREDDYGYAGQGQQGGDWRGDEDFGRDYDRGQQMGGGRRQGIYGQWGNPNEREMWERGGQRGGWQGSDRGWDRENENWQGGGFQGRGWENEYRNEPQQGTGANWNERYEGRSQRTNWNPGMGGGWNQNQETGGFNQGFNPGFNQGRNDRWNEGMRRGNEGMYTGRGPRGYKRGDNRIEEDINERLTQHGMIDASDIEVNVQNGEVTLRGHCDRREAKRLAEDIVESIFGVKEVHNQIKVKQRADGEETRHETDPSGKPRDRKAS